ncbi:transglutaminase domain-containing protein [uncultured Hymenobacter sp.]|uniref:transglutaminase domain-containing protein n=1 Tax=uncultured Hymenobacter sp. TaxID=170016 RepID=UPI0035CACD2E
MGGRLPLSLSATAGVLMLPALLLRPTAAQAQPEPMKLGKIDPKDLTAAPFAQDSAAAAVVLCDYGVTRFVYTSEGFKLESDRVTRLKILRKAGYDAATVRVPLFHRGSSEEKISGLRGFTYNLVNGQVVKTKLESANTFTEERSKNLRVRKFTLPNVREGAVLEYAYTVTSDFLFNFQDWTFQREILVRWSEFRANIPEYFDYKMLMQGYYAPAIQTKEESAAQFTQNMSGGFSGSGFGTQREAPSSETTTARVISHRWVMKDLPALPDEPFMTTPADYVAKIDFEMAGFRLPGQGYQAVAGNWGKINSELLLDDNFGAQLGRGDFLKAQMQALAAKYPDAAQRAAAVREVVMQSVRYDGQNRLYTEGSLKRAFEAHRGTSADVNLLLLAALRDAGLPAQPVLLSTRDHGQVSRDFPLVEKFNYVIALVALEGGRELLVDATEPLLPCGVLPARCLNRTGRLIAPAPDEGRWVDLTPSQRHVFFQQVQLTLAASGALSGQVHEEYGGYAAADERDELTRLGEKKYLVARTAAHAGGSVPAAAIGSREDLSKPLQVNYAFSEPAEDADAGATAPAGQLYLSPFAALSLASNPFPATERRLPVDFGAARDETRLLTLTLPAGYELAEVPKALVVNLPDEGGRFTFAVVNTGPAVQLTSRLNLRKTVYPAAEYAHLRDLYRLMLTKQAEKLIIKKKA